MATGSWTLVCWWRWPRRGQEPGLSGGVRSRLFTPPGKGRYPLGLTSHELTQGLSRSKVMLCPLQEQTLLPRKRSVLHGFCCNHMAVLGGRGGGQDAHGAGRDALTSLLYLVGTSAPSSPSLQMFPSA